MPTTKFTRPRRHPADIHRTRLIAMAAGDANLTLISAPAGWGKSKLAGQLAQAAVDAGRAVVWLTADRYDDATEFWPNLFAATRCQVPDLADPPADPRGDHTGGTVDRWLEAVDGWGRPVTLVIDDLTQVRDHEVFDGLARLVTLAPTSLAVVLVARHNPGLPLAKWRVQGVLAEIRAADLAVSEAEASALLTAMGVRLTPAELRRLLARTEGWIGGVRLAGQLLASAPDRSGALGTLTEAGGGSLARYLIEEVVADLDPRDRDFLRDISVVGTVPVELAAELTGRDDALAGLRRLAAQTGFVSPVDDTERSFRCHQLLVAALRYDLRAGDPARRRSLLERASRWYADHDRPVDGIRAALEAENWSLARDQLDATSSRMTVLGRSATLRRLLAAFPRSVVLGDPVLAGIELSARLWTGDLREHEELVEAIRAGLPQLECVDPARAQTVRAKLTMTDAMTARVRGDYPALRSRMTQALETPPIRAGRPGQRERRLVALSNLGTAELWLGSFDRAADRLSQAIAEADEPSLPELNCLSLIGWIELLAGRLAAARATTERAVAAATRHGWTGTYQVTPAYVARAMIALEGLDLPAAERGLERADQSWAPIAELAMGVTMAWCRARIATARGRPGEAIAILEGIRADVRTRPTGPVLEGLVRWAEAEAAAAADDWGRVDAAGHGLGGPDTALFAGRRSVHRGVPLLAVQILSDPGNRPGLGRQFGVELRRQLWLARAYQLTGQRTRAVGCLHAALDIAAAQGYRLPFRELGAHAGPLLRLLLTGPPDPHRDLVRTILSDLGPGPGPAPNQAAAGPIPVQPVPIFTPREQDLITVLPTRMSNEAIANLLNISTNTVKTHLRSVYRKLGVEDRDAAVERAGRLGLL